MLKKMLFYLEWTTVIFYQRSEGVKRVRTRRGLMTSNVMVHRRKRKMLEHMGVVGVGVK